MKKILFVTNFPPKSLHNALYLCEAFKRLQDYKLKVCFSTNKARRGNILIKIFNKLRLPLDLDNLNKRILKKTKLFLPDIIFIVKGNNVFPTTLKKLKHQYKTKIISWSQDDMFNKINRSYYYTLGLKYYDLIVTQKSFNIFELKNLGAKKIHFQNAAFCLRNHRPFFKTLTKTIDVLFIGSAEKERFESMNFLAKSGIKINVFGYGWHKKRYLAHHINLDIQKKELIGSEYIKAISSSKITLCFLRKINRDLQTNRTFEIPACGAFMLAERTNEHVELFDEGKEVEFFNSKEELLDKVKYYLKNSAQRERIAKAGYNRVLKDKHTYDHRVLEMLEIINED